jgi:hypothetical protein
MSYTLDNPNQTINIKLTEYGRFKLSQGALKFCHYAVGDSDIDYTFGNEPWRTSNNFDITETRTIGALDRYTTIKSFLSPPKSGTDPITGNTLQYITTQQEVINTATTRGFFSGDTVSGFTALTTPNYLINGQLNVPLSSLTGTKTIEITGTGTIPTVGQRLLLSQRNPAMTGSTEGQGVITNQPYLWYQIEAITGSSYPITVQVDRNTANMNGYSGSGVCRTYLYPQFNSINNFYSSGLTTDYWNPDTLSFNDSCLQAADDVKIWNCNNVFYKSVPGNLLNIDNIEEYHQYGSAPFNGLKQFLDLQEDYISIIHFTNNSVSNYYGEFLVNETPVLNLPTIMYDGNTGDTIGLTITAGTEVFNAPTDLRAYRLLYDNFNTGRVLGRVYNNMKLFVITDPELVAATSYKSNRNWTLPEISASLVTTNPVVYPLSNNRLLNVGETIWLTYMFTNTSGYSSGNTYGYSDSLPCLKLFSITNTTNTTSNIKINIKDNFRFLRSDSVIDLVVENPINGEGYTAQNLILLMQKTPSNVKPSPESWVAVDITPEIYSYPTFSGTTIAANAIRRSNTSGSHFVINGDYYTGATNFDLNDYGFDLPTLVQPTRLNFGDEDFFFGNVDTSIGARSFKTSFICQMPIGSFNQSLQNATWVASGAGNDVYVSEVAVYDDQQQIVAIGKLNRPLKKNNKTFLTLELAIDF